MAECRAEIDRIDREMLELLARRLAVAARAGGLKRQLGMPVSDPVRERAVLDSLEARLPDGFPSGAAEPVWQAIFAASRRVQA